MLKLLYNLTGGRPMRAIDDNRFTDVVDGKRVGLYEDKFGRTYLANHGWSWFRVGINSTGD